MKYHVYAIRDAHTGFMTPTVDPNDASACRNFEHAVFDTRSLLNTHKQDFDLYRIGSYNSETGAIEPEYPPVLILPGTSVEV